MSILSAFILCPGFFLIRIHLKTCSDRIDFHADPDPVDHVDTNPDPGPAFKFQINF
jgi:hypothetical protein